MIEAGADTGAIVARAGFDITSDDTALTLNTKAYEAGIGSFEEVLDKLSMAEVPVEAQPASGRNYYGKAKRPSGAGRLDFIGAASDVVRMVRALDHGPYWNPLSVAKIEVDGRVLAVGHAAEGEPLGEAAPGTVVSVDDQSIRVACGQGTVVLSDITALCGGEIVLAALLAPGGMCLRRRMARSVRRLMQR